MLTITQYIAPGTYVQNNTNHVVVVTDVVNHAWNNIKEMQEAMEPIVIYRELIEGKEHIRYSAPLPYFKLNYHSV